MFFWESKLLGQISAIIYSKKEFSNNIFSKQVLSLILVETKVRIQKPTLVVFS